jgi:two-component system OmpR family sensor kinase
MRRTRKPRTAARNSAARLQRLRVQLTLLFTVAFAVGLVVLAFVAIAIDARLRADRLDATLRIKAQAALRSVYFDEDGTLHREGVTGDPTLAEGEPDLFIVIAPPGADGAQELTVAFTPERPEITGLDLGGVARETMAAQGETVTDTEADGAAVRVLALPLYDGSGVRGAVITAGNPAPGRADHHRLALAVWSAGAALALAAAAAGYLLAGRGIRPAAHALAQQERFLADAAHELRTPIAAVRAVAESALAGDEEPRAALERAAALVTRTSSLLDDLLVLARMDAGGQPVRREPLRLDLLVEELLTAHPGVRLDAQPCVVQGDPQLLRRLIENLIENAGRHGRSLNPTAEIEVTVRSGLVAVADRGPGIEPGLEAELFERFRSGRRSGGAGLGLAIAAWVAQAHGGRLTGENRPGGGAVFTLSLPE